MKDLTKKEKGYMLVATIGFIMILAISGLAFLTLAGYESSQVEDQLAYLQAENCALGGLDEAIRQIKLYKVAPESW